MTAATVTPLAATPARPRARSAPVTLPAAGRTPHRAAARSRLTALWLTTKAVAAATGAMAEAAFGWDLEELRHLD